jgi:hypothetical protein
MENNPEDAAKNINLVLGYVRGYDRHIGQLDIKYIEKRLGAVLKYLKELEIKWQVI